MNDRDKIEEAHGIWELEAVRLIAMVEAKGNPHRIQDALDNERIAFREWKEASSRATSKA